MHFSEYSRFEEVERRPPLKNIPMSHIPMFDQVKNSGKSFYKTTYGEDFEKKERLQDLSRQIKIPDFTINNAYDFNELSDKLVQRNSANVSSYFNESKFYKRPHIPDYIKRDNYFQTNAEKNIEYVQTVKGLMPVMKSSSKEKLNYLDYGNSLTKFDSKSCDYAPNVSVKRETEFQSAYNQKNGNIITSDIPSHLRLDKIYQTNSEKNINHVKTNDGTIITYIPNVDKNEEKYNYENLNNQSKRNYSIIF